MKPGRTYLAVALFAFALTLALSACGESEGEAGGTQGERIELTLDANPNPNHAGIYMAQKRGYFEDAGVAVAIRPPSAAMAPIDQVAAGRTDLAIAYGPEAIMAREQGLEVIAVASIVNSGLTSLVWLGHSDVDEIAELRGRKVATSGIPYRDAFLKTVLAYGDVDIEDVTTIDAGDLLLPMLRSGRADAILGVFRNIEGEALRASGADPVVDPVTWAGVPEYDELVLVAQPDRLEEDPESIRGFLEALARGTAAAKDSRQATTALIRELDPDTDLEVLRAQVDNTLPLLSPEGGMSVADWNEFIAWMRDNALIEASIPASDALTNEYLPGDIPD